MVTRPEDVAQAVAPALPCWPLPSHVRRFVPDFGNSRTSKGRARFHVGEDLDGDRGDVVRAMEDGIVTSTQGFAGPYAHAILVLGDSGTTVLYGEVEPRSWLPFGVRAGSRVRRCQPIARVGLNRWGSTMLHIETYAGRVGQNRQWYQGDLAPVELRNPRAFLERAAATPDAPGPTPPPAPRPWPPPPPPVAPSGGDGFVLLVVLALGLGALEGWRRR